MSASSRRGPLSIPTPPKGAIQHATTKPKTPHSDDEHVMYGVEITRIHTASGQRQRIYWDGYGLLHELLEAIITEADDKGWLKQMPI